MTRCRNTGRGKVGRRGHFLMVALGIENLIDKPMDFELVARILLAHFRGALWTPRKT